MSAPWSPLAARLAALDRPWKLDGLSATARAVGGCVRLRLHPAAPIALSGSAASAASVVAVLQDELQQQLAEPSDPHAVTSQITGATLAADAAARAAWWSLVAAVSGPTQSRMQAALGLSALGQDPPAASADEHDSAFRQAVQDSATTARAAVRRWRVAVERGQGKLWLLLGNPCALDHEGEWSAGSAALGALASASTSDSNDQPRHNVSVSAWVSADGVGLIASGSALSAAEDPGDLARRVATALGRAATRPFADRDFLRAQGALLKHLRGPDQELFETLSRFALPDHPSWLVPLGEANRQASVSHAQIQAAWRELLRGPLRIAVLANASAQQGQLAAEQVERWLPRGKLACDPGAAAAQPPHAGQHKLAAVAEPYTTHLVAVVPEPSAQSPRLASLTATALGAGGLLAHALETLSTASSTVKVLGGQRHPVIVVRLRAAADEIDEAFERVRKLLASLGRSGLDERNRKRAFELWSSRQTKRSQLPNQRLVSLWLGHEPQQTPPQVARWQKWLQESFVQTRTVVVLGK